MAKVRTLTDESLQRVQAVVLRLERQVQNLLQRQAVMRAAWQSQLGDTFLGCRYELDEELTGSDATVDATIVYLVGAGRNKAGDSITLHNPQTDAAGVYQYWGIENARGWAVWNYRQQRWEIWDIQCPPS